MSITLQRIARLANVSVSTASKALSYSREINEETAELVRETARQNGYFSHKKNTSLKNQKHISPRIAIICPEIISVHYAGLATKIARFLETAGASSQVFICNFNKKTEQEILKKCLENIGINGVISLFSGDIGVDMGLPFVCLGKSDIFNCVYFDIEGGITDAVAFAKKLGHTRIAFLGEALTDSKAKAFKTSVESCGLAFDESLSLVSCSRFEAAGFELMTKLLKSGTKLPTLCLCAY